MQANQETPQSATQQPRSSNCQPCGSHTTLEYTTTPVQLYQEENNNSATSSFMSKHTSMHTWWDPSQNDCSLNTFLAELDEDKKHKLVFWNPNMLDIIEGANIITSSLASRLSKSMRVFAETYGKDNRCLCKVIFVPALTLEKILCRCTGSFYEESFSLKIFLIVLNFCVPPENQVCYRQRINMKTRLDMSLREE